MLPLNSITYFLYSSSYNPSLIQKTLFKLKLLFQGIIEQDHLSKNVKKFRSDKKINFSNESVKKPIICDLLFIIAIYSLQNVNKQSSKMKNKYFYNKHSFSQFGAHFVCRSKILTYHEVFQKTIFGSSLPIKN